MKVKMPDIDLILSRFTVQHTQRCELDNTNDHSGEQCKCQAQMLYTFVLAGAQTVQPLKA